MQVFTKADFLEDLEGHADNMKYGAVFIYPTDTLYGIGCDARNNALVQRVRRIKNSRDNPLSVIVPSKDWIYENLKVEKKHEKWLDKLPGPYTLIFEKKVLDCVSADVNPFNNTLGVRIPKNWFAKVVETLDFPIITTSINLHSQDPFTSVKDIPDHIKTMVDLAIDDGIIKGKPSTLVDLTKSTENIIER